MNDFELSDDAKFWLTMLGYIGGTMVLTWFCYKWFAAMIGKSVAAELIKAGIIIVA